MTLLTTRSRQSNAAVPNPTVPAHTLIVLHALGKEDCGVESHNASLTGDRRCANHGVQYPSPDSEDLVLPIHAGIA